MKEEGRRTKGKEEGTEIEEAVPADAAAIAALHAESWRTAYRGFLPDTFLDGPVFDERLQFWMARMAAPDPHRRLVIKAVSDDRMLGFACVVLDADEKWGALLDNLHVRPDLKGRGIGKRLFDRARAWIATVEPDRCMHLTVIEANQYARRFYDREGGRIVERLMAEHVPGTHVPILRYLWDPLGSR
jgi:GNAT superfamily N-acetyltransferase